jgi:ATP-dependent helicase/nuclease subunit A
MDSNLAAIRERMTYVYPHKALAQIPSKLAASAAAHGELVPQNTARSRPAFLSSGGLTPAERGTAMHTYMQFADHGACNDTAAEAARLVQRGFLTQAQADTLDHTRLAAFYNGELYRRMSVSPRVLREYHFTCRLSAAAIDPTLSADTEEFIVVQGIADCLVEENGKLVIVDYKTDRVKTLDALCVRYAPQLRMYARAATEILGIPVKEAVLYSIHLGQTVRVDIKDEKK